MIYNQSNKAACHINLFTAVCPAPRTVSGTQVLKQTMHFLNGMTQDLDKCAYYLYIKKVNHKWVKYQEH